MNERIRELAINCATHMDWDNPSADPAEYTFSPPDVEKFAQLIVRECAEICKKQEYDYWRSSEDQDFTPQDCADAIKQHFGIE